MWDSMHRGMLEMMSAIQMNGNVPRTLINEKTNCIHAQSPDVDEGYLYCMRLIWPNNDEYVEIGREQEVLVLVSCRSCRKKLISDGWI